VLESVRGRMLSREANAAVVECGAFALRVRIPLGSNPGATGSEVSLHVHLLFRDDQLHLYGFVTPAERDIFRVLLTVSGLGPEKALALLGALSPASIAVAVLEKDPKRFQIVKGVGTKLAQRMALELDGKLDAWAVPGATPSGSDASGAPRHEDELLVATLARLGYPRAQAERAASQALETVEEGAPLEVLVKTALRGLQNPT